MRKIYVMAAAVTAAVMIQSVPFAVMAESETQTGAEALIASGDETIAKEEVVEDWMVPIYADELNDGVYEIDVKSSSSMFSIEECTLTVEDGEMSAVMTMGGTGYLKVYMGPVEEAAVSSEEDCIPFVETEEGRHTFEVPVEALDEGIACSAFSKKKEKWYDRELVFVSTSLPEEAFKEIKMTTAEDLGLEDGVYLAEVTLSGGSGKAYVESPAEITVEGGEMTAQIIFSSKNYDYVLVKGTKYDYVNTEGNSTFLLPLFGFDYNMPIVADTTAMSVPHEIDYTLYFDSSTLTEKE